MTLKLSEVKKRCGIGVDTLRRLIEDGVLPGAVRAKNGHTYLRPDAVPTHAEAVALIEGQLAAELARTRDLLAVVEVEIEAARNDLDLAVENPRAPLGYDLLTLRTRGMHHDPNASKLAAAMSELEVTAWSVRVWHTDLTNALAVHPDQVD